MTTPDAAPPRDVEDVAEAASSATVEAAEASSATGKAAGAVSSAGQEAGAVSSTKAASSTSVDATEALAREAKRGFALAAGLGERGLEEAGDRLRELNERVLESTRGTSEAYLHTYERNLKRFADLHEKAGRRSPFEWVSATAIAQAGFVRDVAEAYGAAGREIARSR